ncbi:MAG TPA: STAS domain-containing protein [Vicinamibacterales bacterium]|jgi:anti-anti-sigma factor
MAEPFRLTVGSLGSLPLLRLGGDMTFGQDLSALRQAASRVAGDGHTRIALDMSRVGITDSSGLSALLDIKQLVGGINGRVLLLRPSDRLRGVLALMRVSVLFELVDDEAELMRREGGSVDRG